MGLIPADRSYYARNSRGKMVVDVVFVGFLVCLTVGVTVGHDQRMLLRFILVTAGHP